jgi:hypothetical protein
MVLVSYKLFKWYRTVKTSSARFGLAVVRRLLHAGLCDILPLRGEPHDHGGVYQPMVLVSDKPSNDIGLLQTKLSNREGHEARRVGLEAMPLDQQIKSGHGEREPGVCAAKAA